MLGFSVAILRVAEGTNMGLVAGLTRVLHFEGAFADHITGVPLGTRWGGLVSRPGLLVRLLPAVLVFLLPDIWLGDCLNGLHHASRVHL